MMPNPQDYVLPEADGPAPPDRPDEIHFYIRFRGILIKQRPTPRQPHGLRDEDLSQAQLMWDDNYSSPAEVERRKRRKRPEGDGDNRRRVEQRQADPEQQAVHRGAL